MALLFKKSNENEPLLASQNRLFYNLFFIIWSILLFYTVINFFVSSWSTLAIFIFSNVVISPLILFLARQNLMDPAKLLLVVKGNTFIYIGGVLFGRESGSEYFYFCSLIVPLLIFNLNQRKAIGFSIGIAVFYWILSSLPYDYLTSIIYLEKPVSQELFKKLNFVSAFLMLALILRALVNSITVLRLKLVDQKQNEKRVMAHKNKELEEAQVLGNFGNWSLHRASQHLKWSRHMFDIFKMDAGLGDPKFSQYRDSVFQGDLELWDDVIEKCLNTGVSFNIDYRIYDLKNEATDGVRWIRGKGRPVYDKTGETISLLGTCQNITEQKLEEQKRTELSKELVQASRLSSIGELAAGVGHEINNPLAIASGNMELIAKEIRVANYDNPKMIRLLEKQSEAFDRIKHIVMGLRTYARVDLSEDESCSVQVAVERTIDMINSLYGSEGYKIYLSSPKAELFVLGTPGKIQQVVTNLLQNAKDASEQAADKSISITIQELPGDYLCITVSDKGSGIPSDIQDKIFDSFYTTKGVGKGTGLGLGIVNKIIADMNGGISFTSNPIDGTSFVVTLPIHERKLLTGAVPPIAEAVDRSVAKSTDKPINISSPPMALEHLKVLVVDDEPGVREILVDTISDWGCQITECENGLLALEQVKSNSFDYIFTDLKMPVMDGPTFLRELKKLNLTRTPFTVAVTGGVSDEFTLEGNNSLRDLIDVYISKPFKIEEILEILNQSVSQAS